MAKVRRTISQASMALPFQLRLVYRKSWGHRLRDSISSFMKSCKPIAKYIFPNFIVVHYIYLIMLTIVGSILLYPCKNTPYIDVLFLAAGSCTQGGLATKSTNDFNLYQQIVVYVITFLSTPIIIHGFLAFVRLYWFERYFDNIRDFSRQNFKLRKTMTLQQREQSSGSGNTFQNRNFTDNLFRGKFVSREQPQGTATGMPMDSPAVSPSKSESSSLGTHGSPNHFSRRRQLSEVDPTDIYKSIMMLQGQASSESTASSHNKANGPAFVVQERHERRSNQQLPLQHTPERQHSSSTAGELNKPAQTKSFQKLLRLQRDEGDYDADDASHRFMVTKKKNISRTQSYNAPRRTPSPAPKASSQVYQDDENLAPYEKPKPTPSSSVDEEMSFYPQESLNLQFQADPPKPDRRGSDIQHPFTRTMSTNYLSWQPTFGRNSVFIGLTKQQKEELGGVEYRALRLLCNILVVYYIGFNILAFVIMVPWICASHKYAEIVRQNGISPTWWGFFLAMSSFTDLGLALTADSMVSFDTAPYPLIFMMFFIIIGNTGFPIMLRFIIWIMFKFSRDLSQFKESLGFLLDHPRRCFTLLFPSAPTWWLFLTLVVLNATDWILFIILDFNSTVVKQVSKGYRVLMGLFQSVCTRTAGFNVVDLSQLHPSIQVSYMLMMYVSVLPLAISIRRTNVYEEQSLGMYGDEQDTANDTTDEEGTKDDEQGDETEQNDATPPNPKPKKTSPKSFIGSHLRRQLSFDLWFLFLGLFIICICESRRIEDTSEPEFNVFSILFEIVSAYGTVGLSLGYPNTNTSLSAQFTVLSKLVIIAMLIRGRNRGLPYTLDRAIILPSDKLEQIDRLQDIKAKGKLLAKVDEDPMTIYVKKRSHKLKKAAKRLWKRG
ncbi:hypothetical protein SUVZ_11G2600 [Saccharomyces uvarum]|uniref:Potassium transport protein n=1 Tax=Saccharomyces uvarum TaxID=230603 RepID=A0ABN8WG65_SACUV|nr:hypothetical protein SUVZ_11G2600 [Saccharomyces uvarum]